MAEGDRLIDRVEDGDYERHLEKMNVAFQKKYEELHMNSHIQGFENLVFNGGGAKCIAQIGTLKVFEECGILKNVTRFAGTSGGSLTAAFAALGYTATDIDNILTGVNLNNLIKGTRWWKKLFSWAELAYRIMHDYGLHTASDFETWLGKHIREAPNAGGNEDVTFEELYDNTEKKFGKGIELAVTATDISRKYCVFYHVKTFPGMPIKKALRMSISIPGYFTPVESSVVGDDVGVFVDGGVLCNYPVMCFDGWYLSMEKEDSFFKCYFDFEEIESVPQSKHFADDRFQPRDNKDDNCNKKTVGVMVYTPMEDGVIKTILNERRTKNALDHEQKIPKTDLAKSRVTAMKPKLEEARKVNIQTGIMIKWMKWLNTFLGDEQVDDGVDIDFLMGVMEFARAANADQGSEDAISWDDLKKDYPELIQEIEDNEEEYEVIARLDVRQNPRLLVLLLKIFNFSQNERGDKLLHPSDFFAYLKKLCIPKEDIPKRAEYEELFGNENLDIEHSCKRIFKELGVDEGGKMQFKDLNRYTLKHKFQFMKSFRSTIPPSKFKGYKQYMEHILNSVMTNTERTQLMPKDISRTIGINVEYLKTLDFNMHAHDQRFLINQGIIATLAFLEEWIADQKAQQQDENEQEEK